MSDSNLLLEQQQREVWEAVDRGDTNEVQRLVREVPIEVLTALNPNWMRYWSKMNVVIKAAWEGLIDILELVITAHPSSIHALNEFGNTALTEAIINNKTECARLLLERGVALDHRDNDGETALIFSVVYNQNDVTQLLIDAGANLDHQSNNGFTALMCAARYNKLDSALLLLDGGATLDFQNHRGYAALTYTVKYNSLQSVQLFLDRGASVLLRDNEGRTVLDYARAKGRREAASLLRRQLTWLSRRGFLMFLATQSFLPTAPPPLADTMSRDELDAYYKQFYNPETRPDTAVHSVFVMEELQRFIMKFIGPERDEDKSDEDGEIEEENSLGDY